MPAGEFELIRQHLSGLGAAREDVKLGVGDDAALLDPATSAETLCACARVELDASCNDTVERDIEATFVELIERLRAGGFSPAWVTLVLTLAQADSDLVLAIATSVHRMCERHGIAVIGGDTTAGLASLTIFLTGTRASSAQ